MPPVGVSVSSITEMQKFLPEKTVTPSPGQKPRMTPGSAEVSAASLAWTNAEPGTLMGRVLAPANLRRAYQRVVSNKGAPGADGMTVADLAGYVNSIGQSSRPGCWPVNTIPRQCERLRFPSRRAVYDSWVSPVSWTA